MNNVVAQRTLNFSLKEEKTLRSLIITIQEPYLVTQDMVSFCVEGEMFGCHIGIEGIPEKYSDVYGIDAIQALHMACNLDPFLRRISKKYNLYYLDGEPYFDDL